MCNDLTNELIFDNDFLKYLNKEFLEDDVFAGYVDEVFELMKSHSESNEFWKDSYDLSLLHIIKNIIRDIESTNDLCNEVRMLVDTDKLPILLFIYCWRYMKQEIQGEE